ncbi:MAG: hypothetical protein A2014_04450 [Spirochaetes bacterium GWF1_49_6]|nr:MAG: hypothetical protein A2014_04450 [Spirochaetes bacterium GWF1_49_6]
MKSIFRIFLGFLFVLSFRFAYAVDLSKLQFTKNIKEFDLPNGLHIIVKEEPSIPLVGFSVTYKVGFRNEDIDGKSGLTHLLEHMMFKGTTKYGKGQFDKVMNDLGAENNAFTSYEMTVYWEVLPVAGLEKAIELEADRMVNLLLDPKEFESEKNVVFSELSKHESMPDTQLYHEFDKAMFGEHPFAYSYGRLEDITNAQRDYVMNGLYKKYYVPNNAYIVVVGDVKADEVLAMIKKYFAPIPANPNLPKETPIPLPKKKGVHVEVEGVASENFGEVVFHLPGYDLKNKECQVLSFINESGLIGGFGYWPTLDGGLGFMGYTKEPDYPSESITREYVQENLEDLKNELFYSEMMQYDSISRIMFTIIDLARYHSVGIYNDLVKAYQNITVDDVMSVIEKYLTPDNSGTGFFKVTKKNPKAKPGGGMEEESHGEPIDYSEFDNPTPQAIAEAQERKDFLFKGAVKSITGYLATVKKVTLDNGITILYKPFTMNEKVSISVAFDAGSIYQKKAYQSSYAYDFVFNGGPMFGLENELEKKGVTFKGGSGYDYTSIGIDVPAEFFADAVKWLGLAVKDRKFIPLVLEEKKFNTMKSIEEMANSPSPDLHAKYAVFQLAFGKDGAGLDFYAAKDDVMNLTMQDIYDFYASFYRPENMVIAVVGNLDFDQVVAAVKEQLGGWKQPPAVMKPVGAKLAPKPTQNQVKVVPLDIKQSVVLMGAPSVDYTDVTNYTAYSLALDIFGGGSFTSWLMRSIRDAAGLTYGVYTFPILYGQYSLYRLYMQNAPKDVYTAIDMYKTQLKKYKENGPTDLEVLKFQINKLNSVPFNYENSSKIASMLSTYMLKRGAYDYELSYINLINGLTKADLMKVIKEYFPDYYYIVIAGKDKE